jgi:hypothetical protein
MGNVSYDSSLDFGSVALASGTALPNILNLGKTSVNRMTVDLFAPDAAGGTAVAVTVQGSADGTGGWVDVGKNTFTLADLNAGVCGVAISPNPYQYLQVTLTKTGTFTAGTISGQLNTYVGK